MICLQRKLKVRTDKKEGRFGLIYVNSTRFPVAPMFGCRSAISQIKGKGCRPATGTYNLFYFTRPSEPREMEQHKQQQKGRRPYLKGKIYLAQVNIQKWSIEKNQLKACLKLNR